MDRRDLVGCDLRDLLVGAGLGVGAVLIGIITTGLTIKGLPYYTQDVVEGAVLILALVFSFTLSKRRTS